MRIIYQRQLPSGEQKVTRIEGWVAMLVSIIILIGILALLLVLLPFLLLGILAFIAFIIFLLVGGWVYLGFRIGFRELWELTKMVFGIGFGGSPGESRRERLSRIWEERIKGKDGVWIK
jgi:uncharacterized membrane protein